MLEASFKISHLLDLETPGGRTSFKLSKTSFISLRRFLSANLWESLWSSDRPEVLERREIWLSRLEAVSIGSTAEFRRLRRAVLAANFCRIKGRRALKMGESAFSNVLLKASGRFKASKAEWVGLTLVIEAVELLLREETSETNSAMERDRRFCGVVVILCAEVASGSVSFFSSVFTFPFSISEIIASSRGPEEELDIAIGIVVLILTSLRADVLLILGESGTCCWLAAAEMVV